MTWVRALPRKVGGTTDLFYCKDCESHSSPQSPPNPETNQTEWHKKVLERNLGWSEQLLDALWAEGVSGPIVDVGCGIGSLLLAAKRRQISGTGYDLDGDAIRYGKSEFGLDLRAELWTENSVDTFGLITCISVLEHIHQPRPMIAEMLRSAQARQASVYLSVPFIDRVWWPATRDADTLRPGHLFEHPHVHVAHFSHKGMETVCRQFGATDYRLVNVAKAWYGALIKF